MVGPTFAANPTPPLSTSPSPISSPVPLPSTTTATAHSRRHSVQTGYSKTIASQSRTSRIGETSDSVLQSLDIASGFDESKTITPISEHDTAVTTTTTTTTTTIIIVFLYSRL